MSRNKKHRNKPYRGPDAAETQPVVHRYKAVVRSPWGEWRHEHKRQARVIALVGGGVVVFGSLLLELLRLILHW